MLTCPSVPSTETFPYQGPPAGLQDHHRSANLVRDADPWAYYNLPVGPPFGSMPALADDMNGILGHVSMQTRPGVRTGGGHWRGPSRGPSNSQMPFNDAWWSSGEMTPGGQHNKALWNGSSHRYPEPGPSDRRRTFLTTPDPVLGSPMGGSMRVSMAGLPGGGLGGLPAAPPGVPSGPPGFLMPYGVGYNPMLEGPPGGQYFASPPGAMLPSGGHGGHPGHHRGSPQQAAPYLGTSPRRLPQQAAPYLGTGPSGLPQQAAPYLGASPRGMSTYAGSVGSPHHARMNMFHTPRPGHTIQRPIAATSKAKGKQRAVDAVPGPLVQGGGISRRRVPSQAGSAPPAVDEGSQSRKEICEHCRERFVNIEYVPICL